MNKKEIEKVLYEHKLWLNGDPNGKRANLSGAYLNCANLSGAYLNCADLSGANLSRAYLNCADLRGADLCDANLSGAYLCDANLSGAYLNCADLSGADLRGANLNCAYLSGADLRGANLCDANLRGADLHEAKNINIPMSCPEKGSFIGFKKAYFNKMKNGLYIGYPVIVELEIHKDALRSSATGRKCRCSKAKVLSITNIDGSECRYNVAISGYDKNFIYKVGEIVQVNNFDTNRFNECAPGIHFFITRQEAVEY